MGILKNIEGEDLNNESFNTISSTELINHPIDDFSDISSSSSSSDDEQPVEIETPPIRIVKTKKIQSKIPKPILHVKNLGGKKSQGNRQTRRHENMCFLLNLTKDLDEDFAEVRFDDIVETTMSAFAEVLLNKRNMKIWHEFVDLPEDQQERLLAKLETRRTSKENEIDSFVFIEKVSLDKQAENCYRRIDSNIRSTLRNLLRRKHLPMERIVVFEEDLIPFFSEHPDSVYLRNFESSFDRMLLHAVCQYLNLISKTSKRNGESYTQVENRQAPFMRPAVLLSNYLEKLEHRTA